MPGQNAIALLLILAVAAWFLIRWLDNTETPLPPRQARHTCELRVYGRICGLAAAHRDRHIDGTYVWTCPGCHDVGVAHGYLNNDPNEVAL
ncbi:MAG TPA: hypothetical protein VGF17_24575 [Phytomonospora sp.]